MKKQMVLLLALIIAGTTATFAQGGGGGFRQRTVEERVQSIHHVIDSAFKLDAAKLIQTDSVFATYYRATDKIRQELMSGGERPDRAVMMEKLAPATEARDKELKVILGDDNFKKFKDEIEPSMRRGGGGGPRQR
jgi:periplasmic protein CpxP/Spy